MCETVTEKPGSTSANGIIFEDRVTINSDENAITHSVVMLSNVNNQRAANIVTAAAVELCCCFGEASGKCRSANGT